MQGLLMEASIQPWEDDDNILNNIIGISYALKCITCIIHLHYAWIFLIAYTNSYIPFTLHNIFLAILNVCIYREMYSEESMAVRPVKNLSILTFRDLPKAHHVHPC